MSDKDPFYPESRLVFAKRAELYGMWIYDEVESDYPGLVATNKHGETDDFVLAEAKALVAAWDEAAAATRSAFVQLESTYQDEVDRQWGEEG